MKDLKQKAFFGVMWSFFDKAGSQLIGFVFTVLLARMLSPKEFGLVAMAVVFFNISRILVDGGLRDSLIQKKDATDIDYNTVFYFNLTVSLLIFLVVFFSAPLIARFYGYEDITPLVRVLSLNVLIHSFSIVQTAIAVKAMKFKLLLKLRLPAAIISGLAGLLLAWYDYGVWALVYQILLESSIFVALLWIAASWKPAWKFNRPVFDFHWRHGSRLLMNDFMSALYKNMYSLIIGKYFTPAQLGLYNRADTFRVFTYNNTIDTVQTVSYPILVQVQEDHGKLKDTYRRILQATLFVVMPISVLLITQASPIINFLLTAKWLPAAPILVILSFTLVLSPFNSINLNVLKVKRRTDLLLRLGIIGKVIGIIVVAISVQFGFTWLVLSSLITAGIALFLNNHYTNKLINYSVIEQLTDMFPLIIAYVVSLTATYLIINVFEFKSDLLSIFVASVIMAFSYTGTIYFVKRGLIMEMIGLSKLIRL